MYWTPTTVNPANQLNRCMHVVGKYQISSEGQTCPFKQSAGHPVQLYTYSGPADRFAGLTVVSITQTHYYICSSSPHGGGAIPAPPLYGAGVSEEGWSLEKFVTHMLKFMQFLT